MQNMNFFGTSDNAANINTTNNKPENVNLEFDEKFKQLFCNKSFLSPILKNTIPEYSLLDLDTIEDLIIPDGETQVEARQVNTEDVGGEGETKIYYDVFIECKLPDGRSAAADIYFDLEMQRDGNPGYNIGNRGLYYACRMINRQLKHITKKETYDRLRPIYSVWIVTSEYPPDLADKKYTISLKGECSDPGINTHHMDGVLGLMRIDFIYLAKTATTSSDNLIKYLHSVFNREIMDAHSNPYAEHMSKFKKEVDAYMSLAEMYVERGREEGREKGREEGREEGIKIFIKAMRGMGADESVIIVMLQKEYGLSKDRAVSYCRQYNK